LEIPKQKKYFLRYYRNELQLAFLRYYMVFGNATNFVDHTGYSCCPRLLRRLADRYHRMEKTHDKSKKALTEEGMETMHSLETGKMKLKVLPKKEQNGL
jgi:hypothetical protein